MGKLAEVMIELQPYIDQAPVTQKDMYRSACSADDTTINMWQDIWLANIKSNKEKYGPFADKCIGFLYQQFVGKPCIVAGAGPSLKLNGHLLKDRPAWMPLVACLHSFHFLEDVGARPDFYMSLDAGEVTIEEVTEGGKRPESEYWERTKDRTLCAYIGTSPRLLEKWQGRILFFNSPVPSDDFRKKVDEVEVFHQWLSTGGNVLGASMYFAKAYLGCQMISFVGADFSFSNKGKLAFHAWESKYDQNVGNLVKAIDIYGCPIFTWMSYYNFSLWFNYVSQVLPGWYINCTEGGIFGAFREGNIRSVTQMDLAEFLKIWSIENHHYHQAKHPEKYLQGKSDVLLV